MQNIYLVLCYVKTQFFRVISSLVFQSCTVRNPQCLQSSSPEPAVFERAALYSLSPWLYPSLCLATAAGSLALLEMNWIFLPACWCQAWRQDEMWGCCGWDLSADSSFSLVHKEKERRKNQNPAKHWWMIQMQTFPSLLVVALKQNFKGIFPFIQKLVAIQRSCMKISMEFAMQVAKVYRNKSIASFCSTLHRYTLLLHTSPDLEHDEDCVHRSSVGL